MNNNVYAPFAQNYSMANNRLYVPTAPSQNSNSGGAPKNIAIVSGTTALGALGGFLKSKLVDVPDVKRGLQDEFIKCKNAMAQNEKTIADK
ncbi:hypothetical protein tpqmel_0900, partial [Candidatus Gastranaerophilus sp. (ex Termes propinquus)]